MKITLPLPRREIVGVRTIADRSYYYGERPNVVNANDIMDIIETKVVPTVVFDRDFQARRRLAGASRLALLAVAVPFVGLLYAIHWVGENIIGRALEFIHETVVGLVERAGIDTWVSLPVAFRRQFDAVLGR